jgi:hypothetical protein
MTGGWGVLLNAHHPRKEGIEGGLAGYLQVSLTIPEKVFSDGCEIVKCHKPM